MIAVCQESRVHPARSSWRQRAVLKGRVSKVLSPSSQFKLEAMTYPEGKLRQAKPAYFPCSQIIPFSLSPSFPVHLFIMALIRYCYFKRRACLSNIHPCVPQQQRHALQPCSSLRHSMGPVLPSCSSNFHWTNVWIIINESPWCLSVQLRALFTLYYFFTFDIKYYSQWTDVKVMQ